MSMVQLIKAVRYNVDAFLPLFISHGIKLEEIYEAIAAALAEAEKVDAKIESLERGVLACGVLIDQMNDRAEQAGADWTRAREAWRRRGDLVRSAFFAEDFDCLDQFFGGGEAAE